MRILGDGGFSVVYLATHLPTGELRALKVGPLDDAGRFQREVRLLGALAGPHIVRYHEHGELPGKFWIAMEYLGEFTLADLIRTRPTTEHALLLAEQVLNGLATLHAANVVHRDLKPDNAIVDESFRLRLIDFGLAKPLPGSPAARSLSTTAGLIGTPRYMSPEQVRGEAGVSFPADLWALGCILFELLTGRPLFESDNIMALGHEILTRQVDLDRPEIPAEVREFLGHCLDRDPARRWANANEALADYRSVAEMRRRLRRERYRESWCQILEKRLLEKFVVAHRGEMPADGGGEFVALARQEGVEEVDDERLPEVLGPLMDSQKRVVECQQTLAQARQQAQDGEGVRALEQTLHLRQQEVRKKLEGLLPEEFRRWEHRKQQEQANQEREKRAEARRQEALVERERQLRLAGLLPQEEPLHSAVRREVREGPVSGTMIAVVVVVLFFLAVAVLGWLSRS
jgi:hypothetical protein